MLEAEGLCKSYGAKNVVNKVSFSVVSGECLGIIGPNGAGKTTLFNALDGTVSVDRGTVKLNNQDVSRLTQYERARHGLGRAYQVPRTFVGLSVFENVLAGVMHGPKLRGAAASGEARAILETVGLAQKVNMPAGALPLLDRKRLELAKAMSVGTEVILLDEIAGGLTDEEVHEIIGIVETLKRDRAVIWIEHIAHALMAVATRIMVLNFGEKVADGDPAAVMSSRLVQEIYLGISVDDVA